MSQTKLGSLTESVVNVSIGLTIGFISNIIVLPLFGLAPSLVDSMLIAMVFTVISLVRSYIIRRFFNGLKFGNK